MSRKNNSRVQRRSNQVFVTEPPAAPCVERVISTDKLTSGLPYQRPVEDKEVDRLVREWDERLFEPLAVSYREGRYNVIDGQHRISAMRKLHGGREVMIRCKVYSGMTYEQEAELCYKLDKAKKRLSLSQSTNALAESGLDAETTEIRRLMGDAGFSWALGQRHGGEYEVIATRAVINAYHFLGSAAFSRMFRLLGKTWEGDPRSVMGPVLSGMALFLKTYGEELGDNAFVKRLSAVDPDEIIRRGKLDFSTKNESLRYAKVILEKYNSVRGGKKLTYRFNV